MFGGHVSRSALRRFAAGDLLAVTAFVVIGEYKHGIDPLSVPGLAAETLVPFVVGWAVCGPLAGAYRRALVAGDVDAGRALVARTLAGWAGAVAVAMALRSTEPLHGGVQLSFVAVSLGAGGLFLCAWRLAVVRRY
ncbi:MAG: DUF3054 domain-containing protein [Halobacteriaceae archaeon]